MFGNIDTQKLACGALALGAVWYLEVPTAIANALSATTAAQAVNATAVQAVNATAANALSATTAAAQAVNATTAAKAVQTTLIGIGGFAAVNVFGTQNNHGPLSAGVTQSGNVETTQATTVSDEQVKAELQSILDEYTAKSYIAPKECSYFGDLLKNIDTFKPNHPIDECDTEKFLHEITKVGIERIDNPRALAAIYFRLGFEKNHGSEDYQRLNKQFRQEIKLSPKAKELVPYLDELNARLRKRVTEL